ncbi:hypothetical protein CA265_09320 [Sphingobacteriaceae bacterium GW460-11-11-14-LB5]|nr:hypothetical protein CA265_09320 [Sphingobacteriaceae bacterium GW460-11-11-14-LB5]
MIFKLINTNDKGFLRDDNPRGIVILNWIGNLRLLIEDNRNAMSFKIPACGERRPFFAICEQVAC